MKWRLGGLLLIVVAASAFNIIWLRLEHLMDPRWHGDSQLQIALIVIAVVTIAGLVLTFKLAAPKPWVFAATALVVVAGFVPRVIDAYDESQARATQTVADLRIRGQAPRRPRGEQTGHRGAHRGASALHTR